MVLLQFLIPNVSLLGHLSGVLVGGLHASGALRFLLPSLPFLKRVEEMPCLQPLVRSPWYKLVPSAEALVPSPGFGLGQAGAFLRHAVKPVSDCFAARGWRLPQWGRGAASAGSTPTSPRTMVNGVLLAPSLAANTAPSEAAALEEDEGDLERPSAPLLQPSLSPAEVRAKAAAAAEQRLQAAALIGRPAAGTDKK
jgi:hypothetical protein